MKHDVRLKRLEKAAGIRNGKVRLTLQGAIEAFQRLERGQSVREQIGGAWYTLEDLDRLDRTEPNEPGGRK